jgi:hypothetical protein
LLKLTVTPVLKIGVFEVSLELKKMALLVPLEETGDRVDRQVIHVLPEHVLPERPGGPLLPEIRAGNPVAVAQDSAGGPPRRARPEKSR